MDGSTAIKARDGTPVAMDNHWMPFTPNRAFRAEPAIVARAEGVHYFDPTGRRILDGSSGLFTTPAGHGRREIAEAVGRQLMELDYTPSFLRGHPRAFELAGRIARLMPPGLDRIFFANSGSEAVDSAMKIALAYHRARGEGQRQIFVSRERAYHGVNFGGVALSGMVNNRRTFGIGLPSAVHMRHTHIPENRFSRGEGEHGADLAEDLARVAATHGGESIAAVFVEPVAGSTGVLVPPKGYLARLREICDRHGILLVFDEVITGFGRTGRAFATQAFGVTPDLITMAKAITNGAQPMSAVAVKRAVCDVVMNAAPEGGVELFHGYTWSAHPAACAAALAALDIYEGELLFERAAQMSAYFLDQLFALRDIPIVTDIRGIGMLGGFDVAPMGNPGQRGHLLQRRLFEEGVHIKTTGDAAIVAPAFVMEAGEIDRMCETFRTVLKAL
ncbi:aminotransferase class III-fold pyridoxal phosphate-dependent enzyme [Labrys wisconsinensis]|uniref:Beta-alanine--pyruvate transaminase n=1 Tax=Labrys wisconsinensis TaxID=425677 RepID=A0ABU0JAF1_9HYPH|nr:aminotransferase class III-fold pyridoxal phosphate-dependent enzyme [Labrys wisconsinensis]MDQ0471250.1 beta-alanine--pyruvate transaminase [Labrys wisconsinensis]